MLLSSIFCLLLSNALSFRRDSTILYSRIAYNNLFITYLYDGIGLFGSLFYTSSITQSFHILIFVISLLILNLTGFYPRKLISSEYSSFYQILFTKLQFIKNLTVSNIILKRGEQYTIIEYTLMLLFIITGSVLLISSSDLISIFLSIELQSYGLYLLCTMYRNSESSTSAGLTYFLLGGLSSCFILLGIALIYANLGVTYLDSFYIINNLAGTILGLTQFRIKRLFAYSTISHLGFILLALSINSVESIQSFIFYLIQYSLSNLNAFILLIAIGYSLYAYNDKNINHNNLVDKNNSPIQLISQLKGYFHINSILALSLTITLFSFAGIPPLMGFFAKQMVFSAALQEGFIFLTLIGVLTSVISAVYYLYIVKTMFFDGHSYTYFNKLKDIRIPALIMQKDKVVNKIYFNSQFALSSSLSIIISILTLVILLFMFMPNE
ncbi:hypothetical protein ASPZODRAFT_155593 [Penicilliopsis zonata CBS 506.65]|uniref:NADH-ubiquinone oxidoreductase chain 2 n=1 Tax=Penicilliopsis zonata CBS 506.65 TaxID=1073090 RepID=A0A1L9S495_9EURO|nr:hypothetical protein ASPZODRAFT_155593 [Penicilliopsis zonata CBS 506.65]OJJ41976.1 hypothetical protein ASPZODRAFT_155593 [Penicilliopsis zonata CBS 506.65]